MPEQIGTERLVLRKPHMEDACAIFERGAQDLEVTRYLIWRRHERYVYVCHNEVNKGVTLC